jgi:hypothetical protein
MPHIQPPAQVLRGMIWMHFGSVKQCEGSAEPFRAGIVIAGSLGPPC